MSYSVYSTRGFILGSSSSGEAGKTYLVYTEQFGLVRAHAQGVRHLKSKLRYSLADYGFVTLSLIRGKELWRVTGAVIEGSVSSVIQTSRDMVQIRARILNLIKRLVQGEERNDDLFEALTTLFLDAASVLEGERALACETSTLARCLAVLGYVDETALQGMSQRDMISAINKALRESQL
jgi:recombinational DNA repair protein (RecF pathway)